MSTQSQLAPFTPFTGSTNESMSEICLKGKSSKKKIYFNAKLISYFSSREDQNENKVKSLCVQIENDDQIRGYFLPREMNDYDLGLVASFSFVEKDKRVWLYQIGPKSAKKFLPNLKEEGGCFFVTEKADAEKLWLSWCKKIASML